MKRKKFSQFILPKILLIFVMGFAFFMASIPALSLYAITLDEIPDQAVHDSVMASPDEIQTVRDWVKRIFTGVQNEQPNSYPKVMVRRQDFNILRFGESCMETPITLGKQSFQHGLGTHANSEISVTLPPAVKRFEAFVGVDNNYNTQGIRGSVEFSVEIGGKEVFRSPILRGGNDPFPVRVEIPENTQELVLKVGTTEDGPSHDQSDWADAKLVMKDDSIAWLDDHQNQTFQFGEEIPFSFLYGETSSREFLSDWERSVQSSENPSGMIFQIQWKDPKTGLCVQADVVTYKDYPAVDWVLSFENRGNQDTPILANIQALDLQWQTGVSAQPAVLHQLSGDACQENSFLPLHTPVEADKPIQLKPTGGRSSSISAFPFFNLQYKNQGAITAIGWSGQWAASLERSQSGPTRFLAGMEKTHLLLHPGERIRTPRILLMPWRGEIQDAYNRFRRLMLFHYVPQLDGKPIRMPIALQTFDRYVGTRPEWATEAGQIQAVKAAEALGCDTYWLDAAWFIGGFPNGVGNWTVKPTEFPNGLKPISDACHERNMRFVLWFEPERVAADSLIAREHPEFVFGGEKGGLFKLNDPEARRWLTDLLLQRIKEFGLDVYRNDFNIDPLDFWRNNDTPDRQGMTEIRYIEGLYAMWDEIRATFPHLWIDNCASGGRRIDLETCMRSVPLWRSDTSCSPGHPDWNQLQTYGLGSYIPLFTACGWTPEPYDFRSSATTGALCQWPYMDEAFPWKLAKETIAEVKQNQKFWYGDFYPLTPCSIDPGLWMAYQFHRSDLHAGVVYIFKHRNSPYTGLSIALQKVNPEQQYRVKFIDDARQTETKSMSGKDLVTGFEVRIANAQSSMMIQYEME